MNVAETIVAVRISVTTPWVATTAPVLMDPN